MNGLFHRIEQPFKSIVLLQNFVFIHAVTNCEGKQLKIVFTRPRLFHRRKALNETKETEEEDIVSETVDEVLA